jgi:hypothetical protein
MGFDRIYLTCLEGNHSYTFSLIHTHTLKIKLNNVYTQIPHKSQRHIHYKICKLKIYNTIEFTILKHLTHYTSRLKKSNTLKSIV